MIGEEIRGAIERTPREGLDRVAQALWQAVYAGGVSDAEAVELDALIACRRVTTSAPAAEKKRGRGGARPRAPENIETRRRWLARGYLPPAIAEAFTPGEAAVLAVIADKTGVWGQGACTLAVATMAETAGVCATVVHNALRLARAKGLLRIEERRVSRSRNKTNIITLYSPEWRDWIGRRSAKAKRQDAAQKATEARALRLEGGGCTSVHPILKKVLSKEPTEPSGSVPRATEGERAGKAEPDMKRFRVAVGVPWDAKTMRSPHAAVRSSGQAREPGARVCQVRS